MLVLPIARSCSRLLAPARQTTEDEKGARLPSSKGWCRCTPGVCMPPSEPSLSLDCSAPPGRQTATAALSASLQLRSLCGDLELQDFLPRRPLTASDPCLHQTAAAADFRLRTSATRTSGFGPANSSLNCLSGVYSLPQIVRAGGAVSFAFSPSS